MVGQVFVRISGIILLLLAGAISVRAQDAPADCSHATSIVPSAGICAQKTLDKADARLKNAYRRALRTQRDLDQKSAIIDPSYVGAAAALKAAQQDWAGYRENHCKGVSFRFAGGRMQDMLEMECRTKLANRRTAEIRQLAKDTRD